MDGVPVVCAWSAAIRNGLIFAVQRTRMSHPNPSNNTGGLYLCRLLFCCYFWTISNICFVCTVRIIFSQSVSVSFVYLPVQQVQPMQPVQLLTSTSLSGTCIITGFCCCFEWELAWKYVAGAAGQSDVVLFLIFIILHVRMFTVGIFNEFWFLPQ